MRNIVNFGSRKLEKSRNLGRKILKSRDLGTKKVKSRNLGILFHPLLYFRYELLMFVQVCTALKIFRQISIKNRQLIGLRLHHEEHIWFQDKLLSEQAYEIRLVTLRGEMFTNLFPF